MEPAGLHKPLPVLTARWRELSRRWQREHAPSSSYERLCRSSELEIDDGERASIRKVRATKRKQVMVDVDAIRAMRRQTGEDVSDSDEEKVFANSRSGSESGSDYGSHNIDGLGDKIQSSSWLLKKL